MPLNWLDDEFGLKSTRVFFWSFRITRFSWPNEQLRIYKTTHEYLAYTLIALIIYIRWLL